MMYKVVFCLVLLGLLSPSLLNGQTDETQALDLKWIPISERMAMVQGIMKLNILAIDTGSEVVVVDSLLFPQEARQARGMIETHFGKKVTHLINTHHHWDHTFGNQAFADVTIIALKRSKELMQAEYGSPLDMYQYFQRGMKDVDPTVLPLLEKDARQAILVLPTRTYERKMRLHVGDLDIDLYHCPGLHTDNFTLVSIPALKTVVTRDCFAPGKKLELKGPIQAEQLYQDHLEILERSGGIDIIVQGHGEWINCPGHDLKIGELKKLL